MLAQRGSEVARTSQLLWLLRDDKIIEITERVQEDERQSVYFTDDLEAYRGISNHCTLSGLFHNLHTHIEKIFHWKCL